MRQKFCHNLETLDILGEIMKVTNHSKLWNIELTWYSLSATHWICLYGLEQGFRINSFRSTWPCLIIEILLVPAKFLKPFGFCTVINCIFPFCKTNVFSCFCSVMTQFKLMMHKFPNLDYVAHSSVQLLNLKQSKAMHSISAHQLPWYYQPQQIPSTAWTALITWYMHCKLAYTKIE